MGVFVVSGVVFNCDSAITEAFSKAFISTHSNNSLLTYTVVLREQPPPAAFNDVVFAPINNYCSSALFGAKKGEKLMFFDSHAHLDRYKN